MRGIDPRVQRLEKNLIRHSSTFDKVSERFVTQELKPSIKKWADVQSLLKRYVEPEWAACRQDLRRSHVHELFDQFVEDDRVAIAIEVRKHLSRFFNWAVDRELVAGGNPLVGMKRGDLKANEERGQGATGQF